MGLVSFIPKSPWVKLYMGHDKSELINVWVHFAYHQSQLIVIHTYTWLTSLKNSRSTDSICIIFFRKVKIRWTPLSTCILKYREDFTCPIIFLFQKDFSFHFYSKLKSGLYRFLQARSANERLGLILHYVIYDQH